MNIGHTEIFVSEPLKAKDFYVDVLGFELETVLRDKFVWLKKGPAVIMLRPGRKAEMPNTYQDASSAIVFYTPNLSETRKELESRGLEFQGTDGSPDCLTFRDLDGNWFQLVDPKHA